MSHSAAEPQLNKVGFEEPAVWSQELSFVEEAGRGGRVPFPRMQPLPSHAQLEANALHTRPDRGQHDQPVS